VRGRFVACLVSLVLPSCGLWAVFSSGRADVREVDPSRIPSVLGVWSVGAEDRLSADAEQMLEPDSYVFRRYDRSGGESVWLYVGLYGKSDGLGTGAHTPDTCYPAQGFEVTAQEAVAVPVGSEQQVRARLLRTERQGQVEHVLYWFQPATRWPVAEGIEQFLRVWDAVTGNSHYAFVRVSVALDSRQHEPQTLSEFAAQIAPHVRASLNPRTGS